MRPPEPGASEVNKCHTGTLSIYGLQQALLCQLRALACICTTKVKGRNLGQIINSTYIAPSSRKFLLVNAVLSLLTFVVLNLLPLIRHTNYLQNSQASLPLLISIVSIISRQRNKCNHTQGLL